MREKLIELLDVSCTIANNTCGAIPCDECEGRGENGCTLYYVADHLIANGVTIPVRCKDCKHFFPYDGEEHNVDFDPKDGCTGIGYKSNTNADRIRAMSDEELAEFLGGYQFADMCDEGCENCTYHGDCDKRLLDWLEQPAEVDGNG